MKTTAIIDGKSVAALIRSRLKDEVAAFLADGRRPPGLAVVLVGDNPASILYVQGKMKACKQAGIESVTHRLAACASTEEVLDTLSRLNNDPKVDGILVQLPLPPQVVQDKILSALLPDKDVDGLTAQSLGLLVSGKPGARPCTPKGVIALLDYYKVPIAGRRAVVIGRSILVGKPVSLLLLERHATVTICHSRTEDLETICQSADILVVAAGIRQLVKGSWIKPGSCVIDVGIHHEKMENGQSFICGDVDFTEAKDVAGLITPVPGGVGPMTIAMLLANTLDAYKEHLKNKI